MSKIHSLAAKKRISDSPEERSQRMREVALMKWSKISKKKRKEHSAKMLSAKKKSK